MTKKKNEPSSFEMIAKLSEEVGILTANFQMDAKTHNEQSRILAGNKKILDEQAVKIQEAREELQKLIKKG